MALVYIAINGTNLTQVYSYVFHKSFVVDGINIFVNILVQLKPSPLYPRTQVQSYEPTVLLQVALE